LDIYPEKIDINKPYIFMSEEIAKHEKLHLIIYEPESTPKLSLGDFEGFPKLISEFSKRATKIVLSNPYSESIVFDAIIPLNHCLEVTIFLIYIIRCAYLMKTLLKIQVFLLRSSPRHIWIVCTLGNMRLYQSHWMVARFTRNFSGWQHRHLDAFLQFSI